LPRIDIRGLSEQPIVKHILKSGRVGNIPYYKRACHKAQRALSPYVNRAEKVGCGGEQKFVA
jgi:hypothetical protein